MRGLDLRKMSAKWERRLWYATMGVQRIFISERVGPDLDLGLGEVGVRVTQGSGVRGTQCSSTSPRRSLGKAGGVTDHALNHVPRGIPRGVGCRGHTKNGEGATGYLAWG